MRFAAALPLCLATLTLAAPPAAAADIDVAVAVPPAYMDSVTPAPAQTGGAQPRKPELALVRVAADGARVQAARPRERAPAAPIAVIPEPTGGMALLCGLLAMAHIARRRANWPEG
jgi:hypothetical protein